MKKLLKLFFVLALVLFPFTFFSMRASAAALSSVQDVIEDSRPSQNANHTIQFIATSGVSAGQTIVLTFDDTGDAFDLSSVAFGDLDMAEDTDGTPTSCSGTLTEETLAASPSGATWGVSVNTSTDVITITSGTGTIAAGACVVIEIGDHALNGGAGTNLINNPASPGTYAIDIASGSGADSGTALVAVISTITASVTIDETLSVVVEGDNTVTCPTVANSEGTAASTAIAVPYLTVNSETFYDGCQRLTVSTNASNGYNATLIMSDQLNTGLGDEILDGTCDGGCSDTTAAAWGTNTNNGFGYCLEDDSVHNDMNDDFNGNDCDDATPFFKTIADLAASGTPESIMSNTGTVDTSRVFVSYRLSVPGDQSAGTYTNNLIYVVTPNF